MPAKKFRPSTILIPQAGKLGKNHGKSAALAPASVRRAYGTICAMFLPSREASGIALRARFEAGGVPLREPFKRRRQPQT